MNYLKRITFFFALIAFTACEKPLTACIELEKTSATVGEEVPFQSCSENALSIEWFMEGPEEAPENSQGWSDIFFTHSFTVPGEYIITLNAYDNFSFLGEKKTVTKTLTIN
jgi:hypothetical protein